MKKGKNDNTIKVDFTTHDAFADFFADIPAETLEVPLEEYREVMKDTSPELRHALVELTVDFSHTENIHKARETYLFYKKIYDNSKNKEATFA